MEHKNSNNVDLEALSIRKIEEYSGAIVYTLLVIVFGILGNIMSVMFYGFKVPRTSTNFIITVLAAVDLTACILFSDEIIELCFTVTFKNKPGCKVMYLLNHWVVITSGFMLLFVAVDRYRKICRPFGWQLSIKSAKISFLIIVIAAMVHSVRDLVILDVVNVNVTNEESDQTIEAFYCTHSKVPGLKTAITLFHVLDLLTFIIVFGVCIVLYILISRALWVSRKHIKHANRGEGSSNDGHHEGASSSIWYAGASSIGETSFSDTHSDDTVNDNVMPTMPPSCLPYSPDQIIHEMLDYNADPFNTLSGDVVVVKDVDKSFKINPHVENTQSDSDKTLKYVTFKNNNDLKDDRDIKHHGKITKHHHVEKNVALMMIAITIASIFSFVPYFIVNLTLKRTEGSSEQEFSVGIQIALRSFILNNAINPYIIGLFNSKFRQFVKEIVWKCIGRNRF